MTVLDETQSFEKKQCSLSVLMISSSYPQGKKDWKSVFIRQLIGALSVKPFVKMSYWGPPGELPDSVANTCYLDESLWLDKLMEKGGIAHLLRQGGVRRFVVPAKFLYLLKRACRRQTKVNIFHVNWLQNALPLWGTKKPAIVSVLGSDLGLLKLPGMVMLLRLVFKKRRLVLAPNAGWMVHELEKQFGDIARIIPIPLGINDEWFNLQREWAPLSHHKNPWLVVSRLTRKKIGPLFDWGESVFKGSSTHELHLFGPMQEEMRIPEWVFYHGATYPDDLRQNWFPKAAGLITTSRHDEGRPQVMLEAMAAGLPILASNLPAHRNFITHGHTGWLMDSYKEFNKGISWLSRPENNQEIAAAAKKWVKAEVGTWSDCADRYIEVYRTLSGGSL